MQARLDIRLYNSVVRRIATAQSAQFGVDTPRARKERARWVREVRRSYPMSQFGITWR